MESRGRKKVHCAALGWCAVGFMPCVARPIVLARSLLLFVVVVVELWLVAT